MAGMNKPAVLTITDAIPSADMQRALGVTEHSIRHARFTGLFPASWYGPLVELCEGAGIECPMSAFNWKSPEHMAGEP